MKKVLMIGAHPDDNDLRAGGTALKYIREGFEVRFLSVCNGSGGHHEMKPEEIVKRRRKEAQNVEKITGITYDIWSDINDCEVMADLETRKRMVRYIREYNPDIVFSHRCNDYHADHRNVALLVQDASYLLVVPNFCPEVRAMRGMPVIMYFHDEFKEPIFKPSVIVPTDDVIEQKYQMYNQYVSQMYEWLPYVNGVSGDVPKDEKERLEWLHRPCVPRDGTLLGVDDLNVFLPSNASEYREATCAVKYRDLIVKQYGEDDRAALFAEAFQTSEYGAQLTVKNIKEYFPWVKNAVIGQ